MGIWDPAHAYAYARTVRPPTRRCPCSQWNNFFNFWRSDSQVLSAQPSESRTRLANPEERLPGARRDPHAWDTTAMLACEAWHAPTRRRHQEVLLAKSRGWTLVMHGEARAPYAYGTVAQNTGI